MITEIWRQLTCIVLVQELALRNLPVLAEGMHWVIQSHSTNVLLLQTKESENGNDVMEEMYLMACKSMAQFSGFSI